MARHRAKGERKKGKGSPKPAAVKQGSKGRAILDEIAADMAAKAKVIKERLAKRGIEVGLSTVGAYRKLMEAHSLKPKIMQVAEKMLLERPGLSDSDIAFNLRQVGFKNPSIGTVAAVRSNLRTGEKPILTEEEMLRRVQHVKLGSSEEAIWKEIYEHPRDSVESHKKRLAEKDVTASLTRISKIKTRMRHYFSEKDFSKKPKPIHLTAAQMEMIPRFKRLVEPAIFFKNRSRIDWESETKNAFRKFVLARIPNMVVKYEKERAGLETFVDREIGFLMRQFVRESIMHGMGINRPDTDLVVKIYREKERGLKNNAEIAKKLGCKKSEVDLLWDRYQAYLRIEGRRGRRDE